MTRINTNLSSLVAQHILQRSNDGLQTSLTRLSTGLRINSGKDDPAGLIASQTLGSEITSISQSITNAQQANNIVATADAALAEVSNQLNDIRGLVQASANKGAVSASEIASNQVQLDSSLQSIQRIAQTTIFGGQQLLNGSLSFSVSATGGSLGAFQSSADINISSFDPSLHSASQGDDVTVAVTHAATKKTVAFTGNDFSAGNGASLNDLSTNSTRTTSTLLKADYAVGATDGLNHLSTNSTHTTSTVLKANYAAGGTTGLNQLSTASTHATYTITNAGIDGLASGAGANTFTLTVTGDLGTATTANINVAAAQADSAVVTAAINALTGSTGVKASGSGAAANVTVTSAHVGTGAALTVTGTTSAGGGENGLLTTAIGSVTAGTTGAATPTTFTITGNQGTADVSIANNDAVINGDLSSLVTAVNGASSTTGVTATLDGSGNLKLSSSNVGTSALASIAVKAGGNAGDIALLAGASQTISTGTTGAASPTTFTVTGNVGSTDVSIANNDAVINGDLSSLVTAINGAKSTTGVTAALSGGNLVLTSGSVGTTSLASIAVKAGGNAGDISLVSGVTNTVATGTDGAAKTTTVELIGDSGRSVITFNNDAVINNSNALVNAINAVTAQTGITASSTGGNGADVTLTSLNYGSAAVVTANAIAATTAGDIGTFNAGGTQAGTAGTDAAGTVTTSAGSGAFSAHGEVLSYSDSSITLSAVTNPGLGALTSNFDVTGGALFQIGPNVNFQNQVNVSLGSLDLATLGRNFSTTGSKGLSALQSGGTDNLSSSDLGSAASIVDQAISQIATLRGSLGALQKNTLDSNINSLQTSLEQVTSAQSNIRDADFATETANLTRAQILVQAGTSVLAIANSRPQSVLSLLPRG